MWKAPPASVLNGATAAQAGNYSIPGLRSHAGLRAAPAQWAGVITSLVGLTALSGWMFHLPALTSVLPGAVQMKANTAICMIACGAALLILARRSSVGFERLAQVLALVPFIVGLATLAEYLFDWQLQIDELLVKDAERAFASFGGRMSPFTAAAFVAIGGALATKPFKRLNRLSQLAAVAAFLIGATSLVGYLWNANELVTNSWLPPVAINTACCLVMLGMGILFTPSAGEEPNKRLAVLAQVEIKILAGFLLAMALLLFGGAFTYRSSVRFAESVAWVAHTQEVRANVANVHGSLSGAELAVRDYLLYGQAERLTEYRHLNEIIQKRIAAVKSLTADNPEQQRNVAVLKTAIDGRLDELASVILAYQSFGLPAARALSRIQQTTHGSRDQEVENNTDRMEGVEVRLLADREAATERVRKSTLISLLATLSIAFAVFFALFRGIHREIRGRREAEEALRASDQYNRSIIESSPDCVAILDLDAHLIQMTPQGRSLMGIEDFSNVTHTDWLETWIGEAQGEARRAVALARNGTPGRFNGFRKTQSGLPKWWDVIVAPLRGADDRTSLLLTVARDVTERKLSEEAIRDLNAELREKASQLETTNKELESFTYSVSHDLRAPLRAIDGFALMIEEDCQDKLDEEGKRYLGVIRDNSQKMGVLIDDLLVFSRLGRQPVASRDVNVESIVREVIEETVGTNPTPRIEVGRLPAARGDRGLLRQVWINLISNAIKYSGKANQPVIQVTGAQVGAENHYSVRDNGVGFDMAYANKLFGVFQRLHHADEFAGTGVGLAIVHRIVTRHGGRVWAEGTINHGAVFSFALPNGVNHE
jgi:PAS domain S-box-containing protein